jgi:hypothetical protein
VAVVPAAAGADAEDDELPLPHPESASASTPKTAISAIRYLTSTAYPVRRPLTRSAAPDPALTAQSRCAH